jgi:hypothetical protein
MRWITLALSALILGGTLLSARPEPAVAQTPCVFTLGFRTLYEMIPQIAGPCIENEWHNAENGDGLQRTTRGLMVWRKIDNWTAFTDGHMTWINGPVGLQARLNTERFIWEPVAAPVPAPPPEPTTSGTASGGTSGGGTTSAPANAAPTISIDVDPDRVYAKEEFTVRLRAEDDNGLESVWWWATNTDDENLRDTRSVNCRGATPCGRSWDMRTDEEGEMTIHAMARDTNGQLSAEEVRTVRVREARPTPTPTPTKTS